MRKRQPDTEAQRLVQTYADLILRLGYTYLKSTHDAEDVCQNVLIKLLQTDRAFESAEHERAWIVRATANACKDVLRSARRRTSVALDAVAEAAAPEVPDSAVLEAVMELSQPFREALYLHYYEGYTAREIADMTGGTEDAVAARLSRERTMIDEYEEALDELRFSPEAKRRMAQRIEAVAAAEPLPRPTRRSRALVMAAAAAVLALAVGCTAYLAGAFVSLEDFAEDLFGGAPSQTEVIDKIGRPIGASAVSNGIAITADAVIGDNEHCVAVFSIARTDGMPIEGVDTILDKSFTTVFTGAQLFRVGNTKVGPEYCFYDADPSDNSVQCIVKMTSFIGGDSFIGKIMHVELGDLATGEMTADGKTTLRID